MNKESTSKEIGVLVCPFIAAFPNFIFFSSPQIQTIQIIRIKVFTAICKLISISDIPHTFRISFLISNSCILFALDKLEKIVTTTNTIRETIKVPNIAPPNTMIFFSDHHPEEGLQGHRILRGHGERIIRIPSGNGAKRAPE